MIGQSFVEEMDCGNFFDNMDDLMDIPTEDIGSGFDIGDPDMFPSIWTAQPEPWPASDPFVSSKANPEASTELYVPFENIVQRDDSSNSRNKFQISSPVSVLESSSSSSQTTTSAETIVANVTQDDGPSTKRPRPMAQEPNEEKERGVDSRLVIRIPKHLVSEHDNGDKKKKNKKKKKAKVSSSFSTSSSFSSGLEHEINDIRDSSSSEQQPIRKCMHCEVTKTPQWRLGPMGPKTLCNACGVRYKSGRLFPEYRPAASPTFMPSLHSNSHKKVVEMRSKNCNGDIETANSELHELIPNNNTHIGIAYL